MVGGQAVSEEAVAIVLVRESGRREGTKKVRAPSA